MPSATERREFASSLPLPLPPPLAAASPLAPSVSASASSSTAPAAAAASGAAAAAASSAWPAAVGAVRAVPERRERADGVLVLLDPHEELGHLDWVEDAPDVRHDDGCLLDVVVYVLARVAQEPVAPRERIAVLAYRGPVRGEAAHLLGRQADLAAEHLQHPWRGARLVKEGRVLVE